MAASDTTVPFSIIDGACTVADGGANSITLGLVQAEVKYKIENPSWTEARSRNKHLSTPTARKTGDGNVTGSLTLLVASFYGSAAATPYEVFTGTGGAAAWATNGAGDKQLLKLTLTGTNTTGATQTILFAYCAFSNVDIDPQGGDGLYTLTCEFTDLENAPTVT
jgi:hypothetical protein